MKWPGGNQDFRGTWTTSIEQTRGSSGTSWIEIKVHLVKGTIFVSLDLRCMCDSRVW